MKTKPCEAVPNKPKDDGRSGDEADGGDHDDRDTNNGVHNMR